MLQQTRIIEAIKSFGDQEFTSRDVAKKVPDINEGTIASLLHRWKFGRLQNSGYKETRRAVGKVQIHKVDGHNRFYLTGLPKPVAAVSAPSEAVSDPTWEEVAEAFGFTLKKTVILSLVDNQGREWVLKQY